MRTLMAAMILFFMTGCVVHAAPAWGPGSRHPSRIHTYRYDRHVYQTYCPGYEPCRHERYQGRYYHQPRRGDGFQIYVGPEHRGHPGHGKYRRGR